MSLVISPLRSLMKDIIRRYGEKMKCGLIIKAADMTEEGTRGNSMTQSRSTSLSFMCNNT